MFELSRTAVIFGCCTAFFFTTFFSTLTHANEPVFKQELSPDAVRWKDAFGSSIAYYNDRILVGVSKEINNQYTTSGGAYLYKKASDGDYIKEVRFEVDGADNNSLFGQKVLLSDNFAIVSSPQYSVNGIKSKGVVFIYKRSAEDEWLLHQELLPSEGQYFNEGLFGMTMDMSNNTLLVGGYHYSGEFSGNYYSSSVYMYKLEGDQWIEKNIFKSPVNDVDFGFSGLAIDGNKMAIASTQVAASGNIQGVYIYDNTNGDWVLEATLVPEPSENPKRYGNAIAIDGNTIVVTDRSKRRSDLKPNWHAGAAYIYEHSNNQWQQVHKIFEDSNSFEHVGLTAALENNSLLLGSPKRARHYKRDSFGDWQKMFETFYGNSPVTFTDSGGIFGAYHSTQSGSAYPKRSAKVYEFDISSSELKIALTTHDIQLGKIELTWIPPKGDVQFKLYETIAGVTQELAIDSSSGLVTLYRHQVEAHGFYLKACKAEVCHESKSNTITIEPENTLVGQVWLNNVVPNGQLYASSDNRAFNFEFSHEQEASYQLTYQYQNLTGDTITVNKPITLNELQFTETISDQVANGLLTFYITVNKFDGTSEQHKVTGRSDRKLATPELLSVVSDLSNHYKYTAYWDAVPQAEYYNFFIGYNTANGYLWMKQSYVNWADGQYTFGVPGDAITGVISFKVDAGMRSPAIQSSPIRYSNMSNQIDVNWGDKNKGGTPPTLTIDWPIINSTISIVEPVILQATPYDDGSVDRVIFKLSGPGISPKDIIVKEAPYEADFSRYFNGSHIGKYYIRATVYDNYGKYTEVTQGFSRSIASLPPISINAIEKLSENQYQITWSGQQLAVSSLLVKSPEKQYGYSPNNLGVKQNLDDQFIYNAADSDTWYYLRNCFSDSCNPRQYSEFFQLKDTTKPLHLINIETELLGTALKMNTNN
ncbi:hypothetical protein [Colwellia sp. E150_009]